MGRRGRYVIARVDEYVLYVDKAGVITLGFFLDQRAHPYRSIKFKNLKEVVSVLRGLLKELEAKGLTR